MILPTPVPEVLPEPVPEPAPSGRSTASIDASIHSDPGHHPQAIHRVFPNDLQGFPAIDPQPIWGR
ncbi:MAG: hypothetical protein KGR18_11025, partial [Acidobacteria bacterium]|nr:hypothetical protein [Acidobacteriota bacterium]